jgi:hypothetical protein
MVTDVGVGEGEHQPDFRLTLGIGGFIWLGHLGPVLRPELETRGRAFVRSRGFCLYHPLARAPSGKSVDNPQKSLPIRSARLMLGALRQEERMTDIDHDAAYRFARLADECHAYDIDGLPLRWREEMYQVHINTSVETDKYIGGYDTRSEALECGRIAKAAGALQVYISGPLAQRVPIEKYDL